MGHHSPCRRTCTGFLEQAELFALFLWSSSVCRLLVQILPFTSFHLSLKECVSSGAMYSAHVKPNNGVITLFPVPVRDPRILFLRSIKQTSINIALQTNRSRFASDADKFEASRQSHEMSAWKPEV